jgi:hypothetical protein
MPNAIFVKKELFPQILDIEQIVQAALALQDAENNAGKGKAPQKPPVFELGMILDTYPNDIVIQTDNVDSEADKPIQEALEKAFFGKLIEII